LKDLRYLNSRNLDQAISERVKMALVDQLLDIVDGAHA
jgi:hypothetical protein